MDINYIKNVFTGELNKLKDIIEVCFPGSKGRQSAAKYIIGLL
jgi:hypothetical protein